MTLASEVKNLSNAARQLEPYVVALSAADIAISQMHQQTQGTPSQQGIHPKPSAEEAAHLQSVLEHINFLHQAEQVPICSSFRNLMNNFCPTHLLMVQSPHRRLRKDPDVGKGECRIHPGASPGHASASSSAQDKLLYIKCNLNSIIPFTMYHHVVLSFII